MSFVVLCDLSMLRIQGECTDRYMNDSMLDTS
jgi:hypothetical protein